MQLIASELKPREKLAKLGKSLSWYFFTLIQALLTGLFRKSSPELVDDRLPCEQIGEVQSNSPKKLHHQFSRVINSQIAGLKQLDNWHGLLALLEDLSVIITMSMLSMIFPTLYPVALVVIGSRMRALATLLHESSHRTLAANRFLNDLLGYVAGYSILQIFTAYYESHVIQHHRYLGNLKSDPDLKFHVEEGMYQPMSPSAFSWRYILAPILLLRVPKTLFYLLRDRFLAPLQQLRNWQFLRDYLLFIGFWVILIGVIIATNQWHNFLSFWVFPYLTIFQIVNWFCELAEHYPKLDRSNIDIFMSRNRLGPWWENFLFGMHNENMHLEHHLNPAIPFWNLPKARKIRLQDPTYAAIDNQSGGLFMRGSQGALSAISEMLKYHRQKQ